MSVTSMSTEPGFVASVRARIHEDLKPLFDNSNPCLPALEKTCQKILSLAGGFTGAEQLAQLISRDPGLTCKVLQVANSIAYSPQHVIGSVPHAVTWLGLDTVRSIVTTAQLVEQLREWPDRQYLVGTIIGRALLVAVHANELGAAVNHAALQQLFSSAMLYSIGDLAIAYQAPKLYRSLHDLSSTVHSRPVRELEETKLLGVPKQRIAQALAQMWALPAHVVELFSIEMTGLDGRWQGDRQSFSGLIVGSAAFIAAKTGAGSRADVEEVKRLLVNGTGLPTQVLGDILVRAMDRGNQLARSAGLSSNQGTLSPEPKSPAPSPPPQRPAQSAPAPPVAKSPSPIESNPLETLQALQSSLYKAKDLNSLLGTLVRALHRDAGFERVALALLNPSDTDQLIGRLLLGVDPPALHLTSLTGSLSHEHPYFLSLLKQSGPSLIEDLAAAKSPSINPAFLRLWDPGAAIIAPLRIGTRPIGMIYCDGGPLPGTIKPQDYQAFQLFFGQATLSMNRLAGVL